MGPPLERYCRDGVQHARPVRGAGAYRLALNGDSRDNKECDGTPEVVGKPHKMCAGAVGRSDEDHTTLCDMTHLSKWSLVRSRNGTAPIHR